MLDIRELTKRFGKGAGAVTALHEVSFSIAEGDVSTWAGAELEKSVLNDRFTKTTQAGTKCATAASFTVQPQDQHRPGMLRLRLRFIG